MSIPTYAHTKYGFTNEHGYRITITGNSEQVILAVPEAKGYRAFIPNTEAPSLALAILTAAGFVPRGNRVGSDSFQECIDVAAGYLDDAVLIQSGTAAKKELQRRRDALADEFTAVSTYNGQLPYVKNMIDRIIQLQDEATK